MKVSSFEVDVNCPACFDDLIGAIRRQEGVTDVRAGFTSGCISVTHDGDESQLSAVITGTAHRLVVAGNAEIVQGELHAVADGSCQIHR